MSDEQREYHPDCCVCGCTPSGPVAFSAHHDFVISGNDLITMIEKKVKLRYPFPMFSPEKKIKIHPIVSIK